MALHVFIDTNIFLDFFAYTQDDIEELKKLVGLIKGGMIKLYLTDQVSKEFYRNRESKILQALAEFRKILVPGTPRVLTHYGDVAEYHKVAKVIKKLHNELIERARADALAGDLPADKLFQALIDATQLIEATHDDMAHARARVERNEAPGKDGSLGDRLNWELLLANVDDDVDLHIISKDSDFASSIDVTKPHPALVKEWAEESDGDLNLHAGLRPFLAAHFPDIKVATDLERREAIDRLKGSGSFSTTHLAIAKLAEFEDLLAKAEIDELVTAGLKNSQIQSIGKDLDVAAFYERITEGRLAEYSDDLRKDVIETFGLKQDDPEEEDDSVFFSAV